MVLTLFFLQ